jgi:hypoxanthine phosphoribosyltransferase
LSSLPTVTAGHGFAHPIEEEFAHILDYYGVAWLYEPHTFPLARLDDGRVAEAFTPDFYLPAEDLYVELTTMRPKLIRLKNRKIRRLQALYPEVRVKLFNRKDLRNLMIRYGRDDHALPVLDTQAWEEEE